MGVAYAVAGWLFEVDGVTVNDHAPMTLAQSLSMKDMAVARMRRVWFFGFA
jgi:hypothetical protein